MTRPFHILLALILLFAAGCSTYRVPHRDVSPPRTAPRVLEPTARFASPEINESSGIVKSTAYEGVYWTHNDSGDRARIFPVTRDGQNVGPSNGQGIKVLGATNIDWEDIASDHEGNLLIGAFGNNLNKRRDLSVYILPEPDPYEDTAARILKRVPFHLPEQQDFPPDEPNFDIEALFVANGNWYLLTKHRTDTETKLYRFDSRDPFESNPLTLVASFGARGFVTAADALADGSRVVVINYGSIWLFEPPSAQIGGKTLYDVDQLFQGRVFWRPIRAGQCEAVCFIDPETLLVTNEKGEFFEVKTDELIEVYTELLIDLKE